MPNFTPRTTDQNRRMWGLAHQLRMGKEDIEELVYEISGSRTTHSSELSFDEFNGLIKRMGGEPLPAVAAHSLAGSLQKPARSKGTRSADQVGLRTEQRRRQKAGVKQIVTDAQLRKTMAEWAKDPVRTMPGLDALTQRIIKRPWPPKTTSDCNKVLEAIKSMNRRRNADAPVRSGAAGSQPARRRAA